MWGSKFHKKMKSILLCPGQATETCLKFKYLSVASVNKFCNLNATDLGPLAADDEPFYCKAFTRISKSTSGILWMQVQVHAS